MKRAFFCVGTEAALSWVLSSRCCLLLYLSVSLGMETDSSLLTSEAERQRQEQLYHQLLVQTMGGIETQNPDSRVIQPQPGLCVKTLSLPDNGKVFVNICQSPSIPPPPHLSREQLLELLQSDDPTGYKVPMSLGEPHAELDSNSQGCTAYDVVINNEFFKKCQKDQLFLQFVVTVSLDGLENKYGVELSREWKVLKNRKFLGSMNSQNIRTKSKPVIEEMSAVDQNTSPPAAKQPQFCLVVEPSCGDPEYLTAEIQLPGVVSSRSLVLDLGEDRLLLTARPSLYHLDCFFPLCVDPDSSLAQFNRNTQLLTVKMRVSPSGTT
uniref:PIH1 domain-containing protein 1 n=2 Tax=Paramormyrops kingsleyae TaxID=1676925 RepID=A0A3B3QA22_9TELE